MDANLLIFIFIVTAAYTTGVVTGFGATLIALTFAAHLYPIHTIVSVLVPLNVILTLYLVLRYRKGIDRFQLFRRILPFTLIGLPIGMSIFYFADNKWLKVGYGFFVLVYSVLEMRRTLKEQGQRSTISKTEGMAWLLGGGIMQGLYATGGPLVVFYASRTLYDKTVFRSTMAGLWFVLNTCLFLGHSITGTINYESLTTTFFLLPGLLIATIAGEYLHRKIAQDKFRLLVYALLFFAGASLVIKG